MPCRSVPQNRCPIWIGLDTAIDDGVCTRRHINRRWKLQVSGGVGEEGDWGCFGKTQPCFTFNSSALNHNMTCLQCTTVWCCFTLINNSGQTKNIFGRNTETKTWPPGKSRNFGRNRNFGRITFSAKIACFGWSTLFRLYIEMRGRNKVFRG